jgi:hypothetical protein
MERPRNPERLSSSRSHCGGARFGAITGNSFVQMPGPARLCSRSRECPSRSVPTPPAPQAQTLRHGACRLGYVGGTQPPPRMGHAQDTPSSRGRVCARFHPNRVPRSKARRPQAGLTRQALRQPASRMTARRAGQPYYAPSASWRSSCDAAGAHDRDDGRHDRQRPDRLLRLWRGGPARALVMGPQRAHPASGRSPAGCGAGSRGAPRDRTRAPRRAR